MRLWHKKLISVLPNTQLLSQWRELNCIAKNIQVSGAPNHILVNKILDYNLMYFVAYTKLVLTELDKRNFDIKETTLKKFLSYINISQDYFNSVGMSFSNIYKYWHNDRYLIQCFYNLQEKSVCFTVTLYDCGGISKEEWNKIDNFYNK